MPIKHTHPDRLAASVSRALALRWLARYREARDALEYYEGDISGLPTLPPPAELEDQYTALMREEVIDERPETPSAELRYLDLIEAIIIDQFAKHDAPITSDEEDLGYALRMVRWVHGRANDRTIEEAVAEERRQRFERTPEEKRAIAERLVEILTGDQPASKPSGGGEGGAA